jgi:hypothetical protein
MADGKAFQIRASTATRFFTKDATGHCGGTPHLCYSEFAQFNILPDKSGVPAETMRLDFCSIKVRPFYEVARHFGVTFYADRRSLVRVQA